MNENSRHDGTHSMIHTRNSELFPTPSHPPYGGLILFGKYLLTEIIHADIFYFFGSGENLANSWYEHDSIAFHYLHTFY